ncbi:MAG: CYTH domain-containing protein [Patescibacteria group bacterium]|nr:CYTH domain-containing protein [Patescibacteria group bacterium]
MTQSNQYEIEFRARFDKAAHDRVKKLLDDKAKDLGVDDRDSFIYVFPDKSLKVVHAISQNKAKVALKLNRLGQANEFEEIETSFDPKDFNKMATIFEKMGFTDVQRSFQKRHNYKFRDVEIALKHSDTWGYHAELEIMVPDRAQQEKAEAQIRKVAKELDIMLMTNDEITKFCDQADKK